MAEGIAGTGAGVDHARVPNGLQTPQVRAEVTGGAVAVGGASKGPDRPLLCRGTEGGTVFVGVHIVDVRALPAIAALRGRRI